MIPKNVEILVIEEAKLESTLDKERTAKMLRTLADHIVQDGWSFSTILLKIQILKKIIKMMLILKKLNYYLFPHLRVDFLIFGIN